MKEPSDFQYRQYKDREKIDMLAILAIGKFTTERIDFQSLDITYVDALVFVKVMRRKCCENDYFVRQYWGPSNIKKRLLSVLMNLQQNLLSTELFVLIYNDSKTHIITRWTWGEDRLVDISSLYQRKLDLRKSLHKTLLFSQIPQQNSRPPNPRTQWPFLYSQQGHFGSIVYEQYLLPFYQSAPTSLFNKLSRFLLWISFENPQYLKNISLQKFY